jgi:putative oxidoreductase
MSTIEKIRLWGDSHYTKWMNALRVLLGIVLFFKGIVFARHPHDLVIYIQGTQLEFFSWMVVHFVPYVQLAGGLLIAIGLLTRIAVLFQLPILLGAIIFVNSSVKFFSFYELPLSVLVLLLLITFLIYGSGSWSVDEYVKKETQ